MGSINDKHCKYEEIKPEEYQCSGSGPHYCVDRKGIRKCGKCYIDLERTIPIDMPSKLISNQDPIQLCCGSVVFPYNDGLLILTSINGIYIQKKEDGWYNFIPSEGDITPLYLSLK